MIVAMLFWAAVIGTGFYFIRRYVRAVERRAAADGTREALGERLLLVEEGLESMRSDLARLEESRDFTPAAARRTSRQVKSSVASAVQTFRQGLALSLITAVACTGDGASQAKPDSGTSRAAAAPPATAMAVPALPDSADATAILHALQRLAPPLDRAFDDSLIARVPVDSVLAMVSDSGLVSADVNEQTDSTAAFSRDELRSQLSARHGRAFSQLGHLAYIASRPYPQYSGLVFVRDGRRLTMEVGGWYVLTFVNEYGYTRLRRVSYEMVEGE